MVSGPRPPTRWRVHAACLPCVSACTWCWSKAGRFFLLLPSATSWTIGWHVPFRHGALGALIACSRRGAARARCGDHGAIRGVSGHGTAARSLQCAQALSSASGDRRDAASIGARFGLRAVRVPLEPAHELTARAADVPHAGDDHGALGFAAATSPPCGRSDRRRSRLRTAVVGGMTRERLSGLIRCLPDGLSEIYLHPAIGPYRGSAPGYRYRDELAALDLAGGPGGTAQRRPSAGWVPRLPHPWTLGGASTRARPRHMKWRIVIVAALGLALLLYLVNYVGLRAVVSAAAVSGWSGFAILCCYSLALFVLLGSAWYVLMMPFGHGLHVFIWARMVRDSAAEVLPFSQFGGMRSGARAAILHGVSRAFAFGSMIVDVTTEMLAQMAYIALGVAMLSARAPHNASAQSLTTVFAIGLALAVDRRRTVRRLATPWPLDDGEASRTPLAWCRSCDGGRACRTRRDLSLPRARGVFGDAALCCVASQLRRHLDCVSTDWGPCRCGRGHGHRESRLCGPQRRRHCPERPRRAGRRLCRARSLVRRGCRVWPRRVFIEARS